MSDTITITPEERAEIRAELNNRHLLPYAGLGLRLLTALEAAEARAEKAEKELAGADAEISSLQGQLTDCECADNEAHHTLCEIARLVDVYDQCQEIGDDIGDATIEAVQTLIDEKQQAEAENARLRAERDWLAKNTADRPCTYDSCPFGLQRPTGPDDDDCDKTRAQCWQEAARRAVAGEG